MKKTNRPGPSDVIHLSPSLDAGLPPHGLGQTDEPLPVAGFGSLDGASIRTIVVPLDGSLEAEHALPRALAIARRTGSRLRLVHVVPRFDYLDAWQLQLIEGTSDDDLRGKQNYLREVADRIARNDLVRVETILVDGTDVEASLLKAATGADMVVMASRRRGRLRQLFSPSVADHVRRRLAKPVLLVRGYPFPVDLTGDPIARHILVPLDGSVLAERILEPALELARLETVRITLLNVQNREWSEGIFEHSNPPGYLLGVARKAEQACRLVDAHIVTTNRSVTRAIARYAESRQVDLIVAATATDDGPLSFLGTNLIDTLIRRTTLPILALGVDTAATRAEITTVVR